MKITVIPSDSFISIDGVALVFPFNSAPNLHAIQWGGASGAIETTNGKQHVSTDMADVQPYIDAYNAEVARIAAIVATPLPLADVKAAKLREIEAARDAATYLDVTAHGTQWQADERSRKLLGDALTIALLGAPLPLVWRDIFDVNMSVTSITDLAVIAGAMAVQTQAAYAKSWLLKAQVEAATTIPAVEAIVW